LPETHIRLNYEQFRSDLVGAIKYRVRELGGELKSATAAAKAKKINAQALAQAEREQKLTRFDAAGAYKSEWNALLEMVEKKASAISEDLTVECGAENHNAIIRTSCASVQFGCTPYFCSESKIHVSIFRGRLILPTERGWMSYLSGDGPKRTSEAVFFFDYNASYGWCWREKDNELLTTDALSEVLMHALLDMHQSIEQDRMRERR
jgi:hypothetical protein